MSRMNRFLGYLCAAAVITLVGLLCWQCLDIYLSGSIYSLTNISERFDRWRPLIVICLSAIVLACIFRTRTATRKVHIAISYEHRPSCLKADTQDRSESAGGEPELPQPAKPATFQTAGMNHPGAIRLVLYIIAAILLVLGILNGGLYDVFAKAINICTECIGLG